jgi:hypothetical protein
VGTNLQCARFNLIIQSIFPFGRVAPEPVELFIFSTNIVASALGTLAYLINTLDVHLKWKTATEKSAHITLTFLIRNTMEQNTQNSMCVCARAMHPHDRFFIIFAPNEVISRVVFLSEFNRNQIASSCFEIGQWFAPAADENNWIWIRENIGSMWGVARNFSLKCKLRLNLLRNIIIDFRHALLSRPLYCDIWQNKLFGVTIPSNILRTN